MAREEGQDLVEYAFVLALIAFFLVASNSAFAIVLTTALSTVATNFANDV
jgi:Flp pilus assembly pilin Flp